MNDFDDTERLMNSVSYAESIFINQDLSDKPANVQQMLARYYENLNREAFEHPENFRFKTVKSRIWQNLQT